MGKTDQPRGRILGLLFLGVLMGALDIAIVGPALPAIRSTFGVDARDVAWVLSLYLICDLIGTPLLASLSDLRGRRSIYVLSITLFALGSLVVALSPSFEVLLVGRAMQGFGAGGIFPVASAVIGDLFPVERRGRALGLIGAVFGLAFLIGPVLGGILLHFGWPLLFLVNLPIAVVIIISALRLLPDRRAERVRGIDVPGLLLLSAMVFSLAFGLNRLDAANLLPSLASPLAWPFLAGGVVLMPLFWKREQLAASPLLHPDFLRRRQVKLACALALGAGLTEATVVFAPALLVSTFGVSVERAAYMLLPIVLAMAVGAPLAGRMLDRVGSRAVILTGTLLIGCGLLLVGVIGETVAGFYVAGVVIGFGLASLVGSSLRYVILNEAPADARGVTQGVLTIFTSVGQLVGAALVGALVASHGGAPSGYVLAFDVVGVVLLLLGGAALGLKSRPQERAAAAPAMRQAAAPPLSVATEE